MGVGRVFFTYNGWGEMPGMMGADTYDSIYLVANAIEKAGKLERSRINDAIKQTDEKQRLILMDGGKITFDEHNEISPRIFVEQMSWDEESGELRPHIIWPDYVKEKDFLLPQNYEIGG